VYVDHVRVSSRIGRRRDWAGDGRDKLDGTALVNVDVTVHNTTDAAVSTELGLAIRPWNGGDAEVHERTRAHVGGSPRPHLAFAPDGMLLDW
jgi:hypothetical protein